MPFSDCVQSAIDEGSLDPALGEQAQQLWEATATRYERAGYSRHNAEVLAGDDVIDAFKRKAAEDRHVTLAQLSAARRAQQKVKGSDRLRTLMTDTLEHAANSSNREASLIGQQRALRRLFQSRLQAAIKQHSRNLLGNVRDPAGLKDVVRELHGESTGNATAYAVADSVRQAFEDMRLMFNEAGGAISKLENWGLSSLRRSKAAPSMVAACSTSSIIHSSPRGLTRR